MIRPIFAINMKFQTKQDIPWDVIDEGVEVIGLEVSLASSLLIATWFTRFSRGEGTGAKVVRDFSSPIELRSK